MYKKYTKRLGMYIPHTAKLWLIMRLTTVILLAAFMQVNAAGFAQKITLSKSNAPLKAVLKELRVQSGYNFLYTENLLKIARPVNIKVNEADFQEVLKQIFDKQPLSFSVNENTITVKEKDKTIIDKVIDAFMPAQTITGEVLDEKGEPLPGVSVLLKGTNSGTTSDVNGKFKITVEESSGTLVFSMIGFNTKEVAFNNSAPLSVRLTEARTALNEVVVVGYGTQKKANLTGAVDQIGSETLENRPLPNLTQGLQGVLPNVNIRLADGKPNGAPNINIRGATSIGQGGSALVLIDGAEGDPSMINPNDIESVSVLKDAASAAVYGARGAFGVVLITTKKPMKDTFSITYDGNFSTKQPTVLPNYVTDSFLWATMFNRSFLNWEGTLPQAVNKTLPFSQEYLTELERRSKDPSLPKTDVGPDGKYVYYENTDWYKHLYKDRLPSMEHNLSLSRSTDKASFLVSGRFFNQDGLFRYNSDDFKTYNLRARGSIELFPWLQVNNNFDISNREYHNPLNVGEGGGIWRNIADEGHPMAPLLNPDGTLSHSSAYTVGDLYYGKNGIDTKRGILRNTTGFEAKIFENKIRLIGNHTFQNILNDEFTKRVPVPFSTTPGVIEFLGNQYNDIRNVNDKTNYSATNLYAEFENTFSGKHYFKAMVGGNYEQSTFQRNLMQRNGLIFEDATNINLALGQSTLTSGGYQRWKILGGFFRLNYIFSDRYLLELNARYDGSSKFPENERYGFFPSVSAGWRVSQEPFWHVSPNIISDLKFRGSYGSLGNGNVGAYAFQENFTISQSGRIINGILPQKTSRPSILPEGLTWESSTIKNIGMDMGLLGGKLQLTGDAYIRETTDMYTIGVTLPAIFGAPSPRGNYADMRTKGWELAFNWRDQVKLGGKPFNYNFGFNLADNQAEILKYNNPNKFLNDFYEGMKVGEMWGYTTEGFFTSAQDIATHAEQKLFLSTAKGETLPGDIKFKDLNGDGKITPGDNTVSNSGDRVIIGNSSARYTYGINLGSDWNNFFFSAFFQGVGKQDWYPVTESNVFWGQYNRPYGDIPKWHLKEGMIWSEQNPNSFFPRYVSRLANRSGGTLREQQSKYVMNAAYLRMKNIQLGYNIPQSILTKLKSVKKARVYVTGENLWTWSPLYKTLDNVDVENATSPSDQLFTTTNAGDGYNYPMLKSLTFGLSVTF